MFEEKPPGDNVTIMWSGECEMVHSCFFIQYHIAHLHLHPSMCTFQFLQSKLIFIHTEDNSPLIVDIC